MATSARSPAIANLQLARTPLVGRGREVAEVQAMLLREDVPLLTLTGPGGVGKTRLAKQVVGPLAAHFVDGASFVSLAAVRDPHLVAATLALTLGVPDLGGRSPAEGLRAFLRNRSFLLIVDNVEHVVEAASLLSDLLLSCPGLKVLATSRTALHVSDDHEYPVPPLQLPDPQRVPPLPDLAQIEAVALFVDRARAIDPGFALTEGTAADIADICIRLDGLPLAIELAAVRTRLLSPADLRARLRNRLLLLTEGPRDRPRRLRSLRDAIAWSHELLSPAEQRLLRRLAVFVGGFTLAAAEALHEDVPSASEAAGDGAPLAFDLVAALVEHNLLQRVDRSDTEPRFGMLETIREFAHDQLELSGEADLARSRHAAYYTALAEAAETELRGRDQITWLTQLEREHDNLRVAMAWLLAQGDAATALQLTGALQWFWFQHGHWAEGRRWLERALELAGSGEPTRERAKALTGMGLLCITLSDFAIARARLEVSIVISRTAGDDRGIACALNCLARAAFAQGDYAEARVHATESLVRYRAADDRWGIVSAACTLGIAELDLQPDLARARALYEESLTGAEELGDTWNTGAGLSPSQAIADALAFAAEVRAAAARETTATGVLRLSPREREVLRLLVEGHSNPEIASCLFISDKTVRNRVTSILAKLGVEPRTAAATFALRHGLP